MLPLPLSADGRRNHSNPDANADTHTNADTHPHTNANADPHTNADTNANADAHTYTNLGDRDAGTRFLSAAIA